MRALVYVPIYHGDGPLTLGEALFMAVAIVGTFAGLFAWFWWDERKVVRERAAQAARRRARRGGGPPGRWSGRGPTARRTSTKND